jgi:hypothetical protein
MPDTATPPANPPADPPAPTPTPINPPAPQPTPTPPARLNEPPTGGLTPERVSELVAQGIAEAQAKWESDRLPKLRQEVKDEITVPLQADSLISSFRAEMKALGLYLPKDDDASDQDIPGDIAALDPADHFKIVRTDKDGKKTSKLQVEINRLRNRWIKERKPMKSGDDLATPPVNADGTTHYDAIRKQKKDEQAEEAERRKRGLERVFNTR